MLVKFVRDFQCKLSMTKSFVEVVTDSLQLEALWSNAVDGVVVRGDELLSTLTQLLSAC